MRDIIKLIIADDHTLMRDGLVALLKTNPSIVILGTASNGLELKDLYFQRNPDIILTDIEMPKMTGLEAIKSILEQDSTAKALCLSMHDNDEYVYKVAKAGGKGLINKDTNVDEIIFALNSVLDGKEYFHGEWQGMSRSKIIKIYEKSLADIPDVNHREIQILKYITQGLTSQQMANELEIAKKTIDFYRGQISKKFGIKNQNELIMFANKFCSEREL